MSRARLLARVLCLAGRAHGCTVATLRVLADGLDHVGEGARVGLALIVSGLTVEERAALDRALVEERAREVAKLQARLAARVEKAIVPGSGPVN